MKLKNLKKKIRRLEARLREGPKKLAKLERKFDAMMAEKTRKAQKKAATRAVARQTAKSSTLTQTEKPRLATKSPMKSVSAKRPNASEGVRRRLSLSPERRAQLSAAMKARWAAKRTVVEATPQSFSIAQDVALGQVPPSP